MKPSPRTPILTFEHGEGASREQVADVAPGRLAEQLIDPMWPGSRCAARDRRGLSCIQLDGHG